MKTITLSNKEIEIIKRATDREWYNCKDDWDAEGMDLLEDIDKKLEA